MNNFWSYGCSWTYCYNHSVNIGLKFWSEIVSKELCLNLINRGEAGRSNQYSIKKLLTDLPNIKKDDIVVFQFTYGSRLELPFIDLEKYNEYWSSINIYHGSKIFDNNEEKLIKYIDFVVKYEIELLIKDFEYVLLILDYLENIVGATVRYWFVDVKMHSDIKDKFILDYLSHKLYNPIRSVLFPSENESLVFKLEAEEFISVNNYQIFNDVDLYNKYKFEWLKSDGHPNQKGQEKIAECVLSSIKCDIINSKILEHEKYIEQKKLI